MPDSEVIRFINKAGKIGDGLSKVASPTVVTFVRDFVTVMRAYPHCTEEQQRTRLDGFAKKYGFKY